MKQISSKIGLRLRELRQSRRQTQESLSLECRQRGFAITRTKLAKYEIGMTQVPACFIPILAYVLHVEITDLLPPVARRTEPQFVAEKTNKNLAGQRIRSFRKKRKWTQHGLASVFQKMGVPITREIIANVEAQRSRVKDYQLILFAKALQVPIDFAFSRRSRDNKFSPMFLITIRNPKIRLRPGGAMGNSAHSPAWREKLESSQSGSSRAGENCFTWTMIKVPVHHGCRFFAGLIFTRRICRPRRWKKSQTIFSPCKH